MSSLVFHLRLTNGEESTITLDSYDVMASGALCIRADGRSTYYGPTAWLSIELA